MKNQNSQMNHNTFARSTEHTRSREPQVSKQPPSPPTPNPNPNYKPPIGNNK